MTKKNNNNVKLSPPWDGYMSMLASFFKDDPRIKVGYCDEGRTGTIEVLDSEMYDALSQILRTKLRFGKVTLKLDLIANFDPKPCRKMSDIEALKVVLKDNQAFSKIKVTKGEVFNIVYCIFKPIVLMWYNDNLGSPWKLTSATYELAAQHVFKSGIGVSYATEPPKGAKFRKAKKGGK